MLEHQQHWATLAAEAQALAEYEESRGHYGGVYLSKACMYLCTVEALKLEEASGIPPLLLLPQASRRCSCQNVNLP
jgi:hypothetical protein